MPRTLNPTLQELKDFLAGANKLLKASANNPAVNTNETAADITAMAGIAAHLMTENAQGNVFVRDGLSGFKYMQGLDGRVPGSLLPVDTLKQLAENVFKSRDPAATASETLADASKALTAFRAAWDGVDPVSKNPDPTKKMRITTVDSVTRAYNTADNLTALKKGSAPVEVQDSAGNPVGTEQSATGFARLIDSTMNMFVQAVDSNNAKEVGRATGVVKNEAQAFTMVVDAAVNKANASKTKVIVKPVDFMQDRINAGKGGDPTWSDMFKEFDDPGKQQRNQRKTRGKS